MIFRNCQSGPHRTRSSTICFVAAVALLTASQVIAAQQPPLTEWNELLHKVNLERDKLLGKWQLEGDSVRASGGSPSYVSLPIVLAGCSYDLQTEFTRNDGGGSIQIGLPVGSHLCTVALGGWNDAVSALAEIDKQGAHPSASRRPGTLTNGKRYTVMAKVRLDGDAVSLEILLDGQPYLQWGGKESQISVPDWSSPPYPDRPALGGGCAAVSYHLAWVRVVAGKATLAPPPKEPQITPAALRKMFRGRASYDAKTHVLTLIYDFKSRRQLEDFEGNPAWSNGVISVPLAEHALHIVKFKNVVVSGVIATNASNAGELIRTTGGFAASRSGTTISVGGPGDSVSNQVGPPESVLTSPFEMVLTEKMFLRLGGVIGKERDNKRATVGRVKLCSGLAGAAFSQLTISGEIDQKWAVEFFGVGP